MDIDDETRDRILTEAGFPPNWITESGGATVEHEDRLLAFATIKTAPNVMALGEVIAGLLADSRAIVTGLVKRIAELERSHG